MGDDVDAWLMGDKVPTAKFDEIGATHEGRVIAKKMRQATKFGTDIKLFWDNGDPIMEAVITLQTDERDLAIEDDDGRRRLYVRSPKMRAAISDAVRAAGAQKLEIGGKLGVRYTKNGEGKNPSNPPKLYAAKYERPAPGEDYSEPESGESYDEYSEDPF